MHSSNAVNVLHMLLERQRHPQPWRTHPGTTFKCGAWATADVWHWAESTACRCRRLTLRCRGRASRRAIAIAMVGAIRQCCKPQTAVVCARTTCACACLLSACSCEHCGLSTSDARPCSRLQILLPICCSQPPPTRAAAGRAPAARARAVRRGQSGACCGRKEMLRGGVCVGIAHASWSANAAALQGLAALARLLIMIPCK